MKKIFKRKKDNKNKLSTILKDIKKNTVKFFKDLRKSPKKTILTSINTSLEILKNNLVFFVYLITCVAIGVALRYFTIHTYENLFLLKPVLADLTIVGIFGGISFILKEKNRFPFLLIMSIIFAFICIVNSIYYNFFTSYVSVSFISTSKYAVQVGDAIVENVMKPQDFVYVIAPLLIIFAHLKTRKKHKDKTRANSRDFRKMVVTFIGCFITLFFFIISLTAIEIGRFGKQWNREYIVMKFGIYTYQINDIIKSIEPKITSLFGYDKALKTFNEYYKDRSNTQDWKNEYTNIFKGKNVLVIHSESMQNINLSLSFNGEELTPNLNKLAKKSIYFSNFYSQVSVGTSSDTEFTFSTSLMPSSSGTVFVSYFNREYETIQKLLKEKGYYTFSMHANTADYWNRRIMYQSIGYDDFYSKKDYEIDEVIGLGLSDKSFLRQSVDIIKEIHDKDQPFYGTVITLTNHTPFSDVDKYGDYTVDMREEVVNPETGEVEEKIYPYMEGTKLGNYFKSVHYADEALGEFIDALEKEGILEDTVLVIYGDHDGRLPKADYRRLFNYDKETDSTKDCTQEDDDCVIVDTNTYELIRRVPFIIYSKETEKDLHTEITNVMGMYDCLPTLGNMLGIYNKYALGHDIFDIKDKNIVPFPDSSWVTNKIYYNSSTRSYLPLKETEISDEYIKENNEYVEKLLNASNSTIVFNLIKHARETQEVSSDYIEEKVN